MAFLADIELDLESYSGPFDLLLSLILRDEVDLLEIQLAEVIVTYLDVLQSRGELDLDAATEFLVLIAALLELKSRLMLPPVPGEEDDGEMAPEEAAEELVRRMLEARRYRSAAEHLRELLAGEWGIRFRRAALPRHLRDVQTGELPAGVYRPARLGRAIGELLRMPKVIDLGHVGVARVTVEQRLGHLRGLLRRASRMSFDEAVEGADRVTVAVTLWALLELHKRGEATWHQDEPLGPITIESISGMAA
ncbi:MAG: ScpA family protein [Solirubrobacteraceae bacterium]|nr:ScpA family protein [Solirubrobacteraceae bacterium]